MEISSLIIRFNCSLQIMNVIIIVENCRWIR